MASASALEQMKNNEVFKHQNYDLWTFLCKIAAGYNTSNDLISLVWSAYKDQRIDWDATYDRILLSKTYCTNIGDFHKHLVYSVRSNTNSEQVKIPAKYYIDLKRTFKDQDRFEKFVRDYLKSRFNVAFHVPQYGSIDINDPELNFRGICDHYKNRCEEGKQACKFFEILDNGDIEAAREMLTQATDGKLWGRI